MSVKRFNSRRSYRWVFLWGGLCIGLTIMGLLAMDITGSNILIIIAVVVVVLRLVWSAVQSKKNIIEYVLGTDALLLRRGAEEERLPLINVIDANLIDLTTARDYVQEHRNSDNDSEDGQAGGPNRSATRFCSVPIVLGRLDPLLAGLTGLSTHGFRQSLVLLRIRDGGVLLLSPKYSERMVNAIGKAKGITH